MMYASTRQKIASSIFLLLIAITSSNASAMDLFVSPSGNDSNPGTKENPVASLAVARDKARQFAGKEQVTIHFADGVYYLPETLVFTPEDSGSATNSVTYKATSEGGAILSGGSALKLSWEQHKDGIFKAQTPAGLTIDQVFIDGTNQRMARYPNFDPVKKAEPYQGNAADAFSKDRAAKWSDPTGAYMHVMHTSQWGGYQYRITGKDENGELTYEGGWQNNRPGPMHKKFRMVEHIFEELDAPGEWFHDQETSTLYYMPAAGVDLENVKVEVVRLRHLIDFQGTESNPVKFVSLQGFTVRHAARTFMDTKEPMVRSDWTIYRGGAMLLTGTEDISILDCEFDQVGGNAIFVNNYNRRTQVKGCHIHDVGASGVCFVGDPNALRDPLFRYGEKNDLAKIDRTPGPKTNNYPANSSVEDCLIHGVGTVERQPAGVQIEMAAEITIRDCSVYDTSRAGINIGDGAFGGHLIERCDVFDTVLETHDHGSFNSWGRDRYWRSDHLKSTQDAVDADPKLPFLDAIKTTVIRDSRWRCDHGWDIDLDDGSSNYDIYNNLLLNKGLKLREGFRRHAWNNVMPVGWFHPHVWFIRSNDQVYNNLFSSRHSPALMSKPYNDGETMVDRNLFSTTDEQVLDFSARLGWDENSLLGDPMYVDPINGDFRVKEGSPALKLGFKNFPMDQFGVKKASLKAIARTPDIPFLKNNKNKPTRKQPPLAKEKRRFWQGAILKDLAGEEFSAFGVSKEEGGVAMTDVPQNSMAAKAGLATGDLIQAVNGKSATNVERFLRQVSRTQGEAFKLKVIRDQKAIELEFKPASKTVVETSASADGFKTLSLPRASNYPVIANGKTSNEAVNTLTDGKLAENYGPVFPNSVATGAYKMDLGAVQTVTAINSWSFNQGGRRGAQSVTVYGSDSETDPGWDLKKSQPLGSFYTGPIDNRFAAVSLQATDGKSLGKFRWIIWAVSPLDDTGGLENSAIQELSVETLNQSSGAKSKVKASAQQSAASRTPVHLFILAGQSNMVRLDPNISFTPAVTQAFGKESVIVVKDAAGGQAISRWYKDWKSVQGEPAESGQRGDLYDRLKRKLTKAIEGRDLKTITLVWSQGESDAARNHTAVYRKSLEGLLNQLRQDLNRDDIHFVLGRLSDYTLVTGKHPEWPAMRDLQVKFAESSPLGGWVNADDLNDMTDPKTGQLRNDVHYTKEGYRIFGQRLADKAIALIGLNSLPGKVTDFHGYRCHQFKTANGATVKVICPKTPAAGKPWLWRSLFWEAIKPVYKADLTLVDQGYHVVLVHGDVAGHPKGNAKIDAAYQLLTSKHGFAKKCSMASLSRGTLSLFRWAAANPEKVNSIYVDNGVCNITSWPAGKLVPGSGSQGTGNPGSWENFKRTFGYTTDAQALNSKQSPIDQLEPLAKAGVPILMVCGSKDKAVPYEENDAILEQRYRAIGGPIEVIIQDKGHTHGMQDPTPVINFIKTNSQPSAVAAPEAVK